MRVIPIIPVDDVAMVSSNIAENDYSQWGAGVTYAIKQRVISLATHSIYESAISGNVGNDPTVSENQVSELNPTGAWIYVSKTNRWRAFDGRNSAKSRQAGTITYELLASRTVEVIALTGLEGRTVRIEVKDSAGVTTFDETKTLLDTSNVQTWFQYFTFEPFDYDDAAVFYPISAFVGYKICITIDAGSGFAGVSIIGYGRRRIIGKIQAGTTPKIQDFSTKETDIFGERVIVKRAYAREIEFNIAIKTDDYRRVERILIPLRATPAIYYESETLEHNLIVSGIFSDFSPPLQAMMTYATLTILGDI